MIDFRHLTFLTLCNLKSFTKTANALYITQPAVSQQIKYLENYHKHKLIKFRGKQLQLTEHGELLFDALISMQVNKQKLEDKMQSLNIFQQKIAFGATLTIGEFIMPDLISTWLQNDETLNLTMLVDNTESLLNKLKEGIIDFAILEGRFNKNRYNYSLLKMENYIPVCSKNSHLNGGECTIEELLKECLILREKGSGTRSILEEILQQYNHTFESFNKRLEIGNMSAIKRLIQKNHGISFLYEAVVKEELKNGDLIKIEIPNLKIVREFNLVSLKDHIDHERYSNLFKYLPQLLEQ